MSENRKYRWAHLGDINAFFGLMLDNLAGLILTVSLLAVTSGFPAEFALTHMVPGTALGVFFGDLAFFVLAILLARRTGRSDVTAMPLGIDTPSIFGMTLFVIGPAYQSALSTFPDPQAAARYAWYIGICSLVFSGIFKLICAPFCGLVRKVVPRAGLLGSLTAIALVIISFLPLLDIFAHPLPGFIALAIVLTSLIGQIPLPGRIPGTLGALVVGGGIYYAMQFFGVAGYEASTAVATTWLPQQWMEAWSLEWTSALRDAASYLPIVLPFALGTVVGGIDCTESAAAAGDEYSTGTVVAVEGTATLLAGFCGGVIQTTPYIGHPAYKAMGGRAAYTLATALLVGSAGVMGYFGYILEWLPKPAVFPILIFVGLEISAQSFLATPRRHYAAVAFACVPALAFLANNFPGQILGDETVRVALQENGGLGNPQLQSSLTTVRVLASGFILTSLLWAWGLAAIIDGQLRKAGLVFISAAIMTLFGVIHSPLSGNRVYLPIGPSSWGDLVLPAESRHLIFEFAGGYFFAGVLLLLWGTWAHRSGVLQSIQQSHAEH